MKDRSNYNQLLNILLMDKKSAIIGSITYLFIFMLYLELNPKTKNVWIRRDSNNNYKFRFGGLLLILKNPFEYLSFWYPTHWDIKYYTGAYIFSNFLDKFFFV